MFRARHLLAVVLAVVLATLSFAPIASLRQWRQLQ